MSEDATATAGPPSARHAEDAEPGAPGVGETFELLSDRRDRYALYYLRLRDGVGDVDELVRQVMAWEAWDRPATCPPEQVSHLVEEYTVERLPRLRGVGVVEYSLSTGCIVFTPVAEDVVPYLDRALRDEAFGPEPPDPFVY